MTSFAAAGNDKKDNTKDMPLSIYKWNLVCKSKVYISETKFYIGLEE